MASKMFLLLGLGAAALVLGSGTAHADQPGHLPAHPDGFDVNNPPADIKKLILAAATSGNTALMRSTADAIEKQGYIPQANGLRAAADAVDAAQNALPAAGAVPPGSPVTVPVPGGRVTLPPVLKLPTQPASEPEEPSAAPSGANPLAAALTAALNLADPISNGIQASPQGKVSAFQAQERERGTYTGALDGLYGPGVAMAVASYNIVPYPPFIWSKDKKKTATNKAKFKAAMLKKAGADPTRAEEWSRVAEMAQNT
jgi:hypothetical protein